MRKQKVPLDFITVCVFCFSITVCVYSHSITFVSLSLPHSKIFCYETKNHDNNDSFYNFTL